MRPGLWLSFGTLALFIASGCSSRGGENLFTDDDTIPDFGGDAGDAALPGDERDAGTDAKAPDATADGDAGDDPDAGDATLDDDAGDGATDDEGGLPGLPPAEIACGDDTCTTPDEYCCRPPANVVGPGFSPSCKPAEEECRFSTGPVSNAGIPQYCSNHDDCAGGQCCAVREGSSNFNRRTVAIECKAKCDSDDIEVCDSDHPCSSGNCRQNEAARGVSGCR